MSELKVYTYDDMLDGIADVDVEYCLKSEADKVIAHQKYKRCLAMYHYCAIKALYELDLKGNDVEWKWYSKWMHKWFKLAEKFKPNKEAE